MIRKEEKIKAIKKSIVHWVKDMKAQLEIGDTVVGNMFTPIWSSNAFVMDSAASCPLCQYSKTVGGNGSNACTVCPYKIKYGLACGDAGSHWWNWRKEPCIETCDAMIEALKSLLIVGDIPIEKTYQIGDIFKFYGKTYVLSHTAGYSAIWLVALIAPFTGHLWRSAQPVQNIRKITQKELTLIAGLGHEIEHVRGQFKFIPNTLKLLNGGNNSATWR